MNLIRTIALMSAVLVSAHATAGMISLDSLLYGKTDETSVRKAILEAAMKYGKVVFYFGTESCKYCVTTKAAIHALLSQFPDVMFVLIDLTKYPFLKNGTWPKIRFHKNSTFLQETGSLTQVKLKALLNQYYR